MKKSILGLISAVVIVTMASWGYIGHQAVGIIAENHLTPEARQAVQLLLSGRSLGDIASWADEVRDAKTFPEHFINAPLGLSYEQLITEVKNQPQDNVYKAIQANEAILKNPASGKQEKENALKFIVHFVGDLHQPMHVSRKEDQGGNTIQLQFEDKGTNMHALWDSRMIDKQGLKAEEIAAQFDKATAEQVKQWQAESLMVWIWESYQISSKLYPESMPGSKLEEDYYRSHIAIIDERIEKAGIRLAGLLNELFSKDYVAALSQSIPPPVIKSEPGSKAYPPVKLDEVSKHIGEEVNVIATVADYKELGEILLVNLGAAYPNQQLTLLFRGEAKAFGEKIKEKGTRLIVLGKLIDFKGKPEIEVKEAGQLLMPPPGH
ncbi:S1/P1 nuclease [Mucilaginibacter sp. P25]|uniref:S1/P1 nuclease n=1 Tax=Mucilaginibacter sp. P25 TaxID=3423945 RepID=UPI003D7AF58B